MHVRRTSKAFNGMETEILHGVSDILDTCMCSLASGAIAVNGPFRKLTSRVIP